MKTAVTSIPTPPVFQRSTLHIDIESQQELDFWYALFNNGRFRSLVEKQFGINHTKHGTYSQLCEHGSPTIGCTSKLDVVNY